MPSPASGLNVNAFVSGLDHPRWLYVLPNGDVLVAESNAPDGSGLCSEVKNIAASAVLKYGGARTPSADRISLHRDTDGDGGATTVETGDQNPQPDPTITFIPPFHQIASTATYDPDIRICLDYDPASLKRMVARVGPPTREFSER